MEQDSSTKKRQIIATLAVLIVITVIVAGVALNGKSSTPSTTASTTSDSTQSTPDTAVATTDATAPYTDGDYTVTGTYATPGGQESITVTVTLQDGTITATSAEGSGGSQDSQFYQGDFIRSYSEEVIGKKISNLKLSRVAGASLTSGGFNNAIEQIKTEAAA